MKKDKDRDELSLYFYRYEVDAGGRQLSGLVNEDKIRRNDAELILAEIEKQLIERGCTLRQIESGNLISIRRV